MPTLDPLLLLYRDTVVRIIERTGADGGYRPESLLDALLALLRATDLYEEEIVPQLGLHAAAPTGEAAETMLRLALSILGEHFPPVD